MFRENLSCICSGTKLVMDKISRSFYKDQQSRAEAAPEVLNESNTDWNPFGDVYDRGTEMECA